MSSQPPFTQCKFHCITSPPFLLQWFSLVERVTNVEKLRKLAEGMTLVELAVLVHFAEFLAREFPAGSTNGLT